MRKFDSKRKGFTLVELLIVIVVIGILSAMMMLSSSEAVSSARATTIVADLRNLKTAMLAFYTDNIDNANTTPPTLATILPYLTSATTEDELTKAGYGVTTGDAGWFVQCKVQGTNVAKIRTKLQGRAASTGLLKEAKVPTTSDTRVYAGGDTVFMYVR